MIDGSEKRNRQLAFELQNSHVYEKRSNVLISLRYFAIRFLFFTFPFLFLTFLFLPIYFVLLFSFALTSLTSCFFFSYMP